MSMKQNLSDKQYYDLTKGFTIFGDSTNLKILYELERYGEKNFSELRDGLSINPTTLTKKLRELIRAGLIGADRTHDHLRVYYSVTNHHKPLRRLLDSIERLANDL